MTSLNPFLRQGKAFSLHSWVAGRLVQFWSRRRNKKSSFAQFEYFHLFTLALNNSSCLPLGGVICYFWPKIQNRTSCHQLSGCKISCSLSSLFPLPEAQFFLTHLAAMHRLKRIWGIVSGLDSRLSLPGGQRTSEHSWCCIFHPLLTCSFSVSFSVRTFC